MKIRNGFVSNSSSSSFIVGVAKINDYEKFQNYLKHNHIKLNYDVKVLTLSDIMNKPDMDMHFNNNKIYVESFQTDATLDVKDCSSDDLFFIVNISNNEGDGQFLNDVDDYDLNYDIDESFFDGEQRKIYDAFFNEKSGLDLDKANVYYGAGRNG